MKNTLIALGFTALFAMGTAAAGEPRETATIPLVFEASGKEFPSGNYSIERVGQTRALAIRNLETGRVSLVSAPVVSGRSEHQSSKLVFKRAGDHMRLSEIWFLDEPGMVTTGSSKGEVAASVVVVDMK